MVEDQVLAELPSPALRVYVVWEPVLPGDDRAAAVRAAAALRERSHHDPRIAQYWDPDGQLGWRLGELLALPPSENGPGRAHGFAWDVYLLYDAAARFGASPGFWMNQLWNGGDLSPALDGQELRNRVAALLPAPR